MAIRRSSAFLSPQTGDTDRLRREAEAAFQAFLLRIKELEEDVEDIEEDAGDYAPIGASYVTIAASGALTDERILTAGTNITNARYKPIVHSNGRPANRIRSAPSIVIGARTEQTPATARNLDRVFATESLLTVTE